MNLNNASLVEAIARQYESPRPLHGAIPRRRVTSDPTLPERLPNSAFIQREADDIAPGAILRQVRRAAVAKSPEPTSPRQDPRPSESSRSSSFQTFRKSFIRKSSEDGVWRDPQDYEVFRAIENKDVEFLMKIRDRAFPLLLRKSGDATPLLHAMRIGQSHRDVAILLLGAFSRWVNHLEDEDMKTAGTKTLLKALRTNLKLAIDEGLATTKSDLTASFLQTLIMSDNKWVRSSVSSTCIALRAGSTGEPVKTAGAAVRRFATRELAKAELIASVEDYVANATVDLLMMAAWSLVCEVLPSEPIPDWYFARDDRVFKSFKDKLDKQYPQIKAATGRQLQRQLSILSEVVAGHADTYRRKVEILAQSLDAPPVT